MHTTLGEIHESKLRRVNLTEKIPCGYCDITQHHYGCGFPRWLPDRFYRWLICRNWKWMQRRKGEVVRQDVVIHVRKVEPTQASTGSGAWSMEWPVHLEIRRSK